MFKTFPEFSALSFADRDDYNKLIKEYPPFADISFAGLMGWWGLYEAPKISILNNNIVIYYKDEQSPKNSGLSLIGQTSVDESVCTLFDYLRERGERPRLVHVPEFVIDEMHYPELFSFEGERNYDEYVISLSNFYPLEGAKRYHAKRAAGLMERLTGANVKVGPMDLASKEQQERLLSAAKAWPRKGINNLSTREHEALYNAIIHAVDIGLHNVCLSIDDELHGFLLFDAPFDRQYVTLEYVRVSYAMPHILNFSAYMFAEWFAKQDVTNVNLCMDYGKPMLRVAKLALNPINFFRKYTIKSATE